MQFDVPSEVSPINQKQELHKYAVNSKLKIRCPYIKPFHAKIFQMMLKEIKSNNTS